MDASPRTTAILLFTRSPEEEARHKTFVSHEGRAVNAGVAGRLIEHTHRIAERTELDVFLYSSRQQRGATFGERLAHAFDDLYALGYDRVIAIGNDTPTLTVEDLRQAAAELDRKEAVLGPTLDGGAYLIGLRASAFTAASFAALPWETNRLLASLNAHLIEQGSKVFHLEIQRDVDTPKDLVTLIRRLPARSKLLRALRRLLLRRIRPAGPVPKNISSPSYHKHTLLRAPPSFSPAGFLA